MVYSVLANHGHRVNILPVSIFRRWEIYIIIVFVSEPSIYAVNIYEEFILLKVSKKLNRIRMLWQSKYTVHNKLVVIFPEVFLRETHSLSNLVASSLIVNSGFNFLCSICSLYVIKTKCYKTKQNLPVCSLQGSYRRKRGRNKIYT